LQLPEWVNIFSEVCARNQDALQWGLPEPWVHAELYAELKRQGAYNTWTPFPTEVPYVTIYPVQLPKEANRDWKTKGAVKWVDLCLQSKMCDAWCWFEFKTRHAGGADRGQKAALEARDAFRKDVVALMGFDANATAEIWASPDSYTTAYWFEDLLKPRAERLRSGRHHFVAAFLQLGGEIDNEIWNEQVLFEEIHSWKTHRCKQAGRPVGGAVSNVALSFDRIMANYWLLVLEWSGGLPNGEI
jgi:hypothetical protein